MIHTLERWDTHWTHTSKAWDTVGYNNYKFWDTLYLQDWYAPQCLASGGQWLGMGWALWKGGGGTSPPFQCIPAPPPLSPVVSDPKAPEDNVLIKCSGKYAPEGEAYAPQCFPGASQHAGMGIYGGDIRLPSCAGCATSAHTAWPS